MSFITIGAPIALVTVLIESSTGANIVRARRSQSIQKTAPVSTQAGTMIIGFEVLNIMRTIWGTAIPTKEMGPANAVTHAERMLERIISSTLKSFTFTPRLCA